MAGTLEFKPEDTGHILSMSQLTGNVIMLVKDQGTYLMVRETKGLDPNCNSAGTTVIYAIGCNPDTDGDGWWDKGQRICGGDDFGHCFDYSLTETLAEAWADGRKKLTIKMTAKAIDVRM